MSMQQIIEKVRTFDGVLVVQPGPDSGLPELAWGDAFFYYAPDGRMPTNVQPYGTIVTKDYPDDTSSELGDGRWRVNVHVGRATFVELAGEDPRRLSRSRDLAAVDVVMPHPVYGELGWLAVVNPGAATLELVVRLLTEAHAAARARFERRRT